MLTFKMPELLAHICAQPYFNCNSEIVEDVIRFFLFLFQDLRLEPIGEASPSPTLTNTAPSRRGLSSG
jgi:hypothetical protein